jgi:hypothetical protein
MRYLLSLAVVLAVHPCTAQTQPAPLPDAPSQTATQPPPPPEPKRLLDILPNYSVVGAGVTPPRPSLKLNFKIATEQTFDASSLPSASTAIVLVGLTSLISEGRNAHPTLGKGIGGFGQYYWRAAADRADRSYQGAFFFASLYHQDPRYYAMERGNFVHRVLHAASRTIVTRTYGGTPTPNLAGLSGRIGSEAVSRLYYPHPNTTLGDLAVRFGYGTAREAGFFVFREFYPDISKHFHHHPKPAERTDPNQPQRTGALHPNA